MPTARPILSSYVPAGSRPMGFICLLVRLQRPRLKGRTLPFYLIERRTLKSYVSSNERSADVVPDFRKKLSALRATLTVGLFPQAAGFPDGARPAAPSSPARYRFPPSPAPPPPQERSPVGDRPDRPRIGVAWGTTVETTCRFE
ncbi:hypothetical protein GCM10009581_35890 [Tsukamurella strandjordii]